MLYFKDDLCDCPLNRTRVMKTQCTKQAVFQAREGRRRLVHRLVLPLAAAIGLAVMNPVSAQTVADTVWQSEDGALMKLTDRGVGWLTGCLVESNGESHYVQGFYDPSPVAPPVTTFSGGISWYDASGGALDNSDYWTSSLSGMLFEDSGSYGLEILNNLSATTLFGAHNTSTGIFPDTIVFSEYTNAWSCPSMGSYVSSGIPVGNWETGDGSVVLVINDTFTTNGDVQGYISLDIPGQSPIALNAVGYYDGLTQQSSGRDIALSLGTSVDLDHSQLAFTGTVNQAASYNAMTLQPVGVFATPAAKYLSNVLEDFPLELNRVAGVHMERVPIDEQWVSLPESINPYSGQNILPGETLVFAQPHHVGPDASVIRINRNNGQFFLQEDQSQDSETGHVMDTVDLLGIQNNLNLPYVKTGTVDTDHNWATVAFPEAFASLPVVAAQIATYNGGQAAFAEVRNVTTTSFQVRVREWTYMDQNHLVETIHWVAAEQGTHSGISVEDHVLIAGRAAVVAEASDGMFFTYDFGTPMVEKFVIAHWQSDENAIGPIHTRIKPSSASTITVKAMYEEQIHNTLPSTHFTLAELGYIIVGTPQ